VLSFSGCTLFPLCIIKNADCGCDKAHTIRLSQRTKRKIVVDWDENYVLLLKKEKTLRKLRRYADEKQFRNFYDEQAKKDTIRIDVMKTDFPRFNNYVVRQIRFRSIVIMDKKTREKFRRLRVRRYNLRCKDSHYGAGGKEFGLPEKDKVIVRKRSWIN
jgi:hypothetical protein